ncbi:MAG: hypothetical protein KAT38_07310 [Bacteroidales bacterium]|nr:hypothetical protein [Bacteroidales bacterium]
MNNHLKKFISRGIIISLILFIAGFFLFITILKEYFSFSFPVLLLVIFLITVLFHRYIIRSTGESNRKFPAKFLGATVIKMGLYMILIISYVVFNRENAVPFLLVFMIIYLIFTIFEVVSVLDYINITRDK